MARNTKWDKGPRPCVKCGELYRRKRATAEEWPGTKPYGNGTECAYCAKLRLRRNVRPVSDKMWGHTIKALGMDQSGH